MMSYPNKKHGTNIFTQNVFFPRSLLIKITCLVIPEMNCND